MFHSLRLLIFLPIVLLTVALFGSQQIKPASAAPAGAANGQFVYQQECQSNGLVRARFAWTPSGLGQQFVDVSLSSVFNGWAFSGPLFPHEGLLDWGSLQPNTTYYSRVGTWIGIWVHSDPIAFHTIACSGNFSPADDLRSTKLSPTSVRVAWDRGNGNLSYCVDTANSLGDLYNFRGSWRNHHCGTTANQVDLQGLTCGRDYFWRIWTVGQFTAGHSEVATFTTDTCVFSLPDNLRSQVLSPTSVRFTWDRGIGNAAFCVDTARTLSDLFNFRGTFANHGCGATEPTITATELTCGTQYFWRVYAWGRGDGQSAHAAVTTAPCGSFTPPTNLRTGDIEQTSIEFRWDRGANNVWFCVDTATSLNDLMDFEDSWKNHGCGTTGTMIEAMGLTCNTQYYWRIFAWSATGGGGHSVVSQAETDDC